MKRLVRCVHCRLQYDASSLSTGDRFYCGCGETVVVASLQGHDSPAVRCSQCGAPRKEGRRSCEHCQASFTIHELDLDTVCPACLACVSSRARFCHHCAAVLTADSVAGETCELQCPACVDRPKLFLRRFERLQIGVAECHTCAGLWLNLESLHSLLHGPAVTDRSIPPPAHRTPAPLLPSQGYRSCAACKELMPRRKFAADSRIVVDVCGRHGVWFDFEELSYLLAYMRAGGVEAVRNGAARLTGSPDKLRKTASLTEAKVRMATSTAAWQTRREEEFERDAYRFENLVDGIVEGVFAIFLNRG